MTNRHGLTLAALVLLVGAIGPALAVEGTWFTDADKALAAAVKAKRPVLAVAMDHG